MVCLAREIDFRGELEENRTIGRGLELTMNWIAGQLGEGYIKT